MTAPRKQDDFVSALVESQATRDFVWTDEDRRVVDEMFPEDAGARPRRKPASPFGLNDFTPWISGLVLCGLLAYLLARWILRS